MIILLYRKIQFLHGNCNVPIFDCTSHQYSAKEIVNVLLDQSLPVEKISTSRPTFVEDNFIFVVDLSKLDDPKDVRADDLGSWICNGKRSVQCAIEDGRAFEIVPTSNTNVGITYRLIRRYYKHATAGDFARIISEIYG